MCFVCMAPPSAPQKETHIPAVSSFPGSCGSLAVRAGVASVVCNKREGWAPPAASSSRLALPQGASKNCRRSSATLHTLDWLHCERKKGHHSRTSCLNFGQSPASIRWYMPALGHAGKAKPVETKQSGNGECYISFQDRNKPGTER